MRRLFMVDKDGLDWVLRTSQLTLRFRLDGVAILDVVSNGTIEVTANGIATHPKVLLPNLRGFIPDGGWWVYFHVGRMGVTVRYTRSNEFAVAELLFSLVKIEGIEEDVGYVRLTLDGNWNLRNCVVSDILLTEDFLRRLIFNILQTSVKETAQEKGEQ
jgi:hypothetical protein